MPMDLLWIDISFLTSSVDMALPEGKLMSKYPWSFPVARLNLTNHFSLIWVC